MKTTTSLYEFDSENGELSTLDGDVFYINPGDYPTACCWISSTPLEISAEKGRTKIKNLSTDEVIWVLY